MEEGLPGIAEAFRKVANGDRVFQKAIRSGQGGKEDGQRPSFRRAFPEVENVRAELLAFVGNSGSGLRSWRPLKSLELGLNSALTGSFIRQTCTVYPYCAKHWVAMLERSR